MGHRVGDRERNRTEDLFQAEKHKVLHSEIICHFQGNDCLNHLFPALD